MWQLDTTSTPCTSWWYRNIWTSLCLFVFVVFYAFVFVYLCVCVHQHLCSAAEVDKGGPGTGGRSSPIIDPHHCALLGGTQMLCQANKHLCRPSYLQGETTIFIFSSKNSYVRDHLVRRLTTSFPAWCAPDLSSTCQCQPWQARFTSVPGRFLNHQGPTWCLKHCMTIINKEGPK